MLKNPAIDLRNVSAGYHHREVLRNVDLQIPRSHITTIIGPNGCGKSTLLRTMGKLITPTTGEIHVNNRAIRAMKPRALAKNLALLPQSPSAPEGLTVRDLASRGRQPHRPWYRQWSPEDDEIINQALAATRLTDLADRPLDELSGGQRQRAWVAMVLTQETPTILLDEPTTHLDLAHSVEVLELVTRLCLDRGKTIVMVLHDLGLAARFSHNLVVTKEGRIVAEGKPSDLVNAPLLEEVFGLEAHVFDDPFDALPTVVPAGHV